MSHEILMSVYKNNALTFQSSTALTALVIEQDNEFTLGMHQYHNFISDTDFDTPFSVSADVEF